MKKLVIVAVIIVGLVVVGVVLLVGNINPLIKKGVEKGGSMVLKAPVTLTAADISFSSGTGELQGLTIGNPAGYKAGHAFQMDRLKVVLDVKSVTSDTIHIKEVLIDSPNIVFEGLFGKNNLKQLQENAMAFAASLGSGGGEKKEASGAQSKKVVVDHLKIQNGSISVSMGILQGKKLTVALPTLELNDIGKGRDASFADVLGEILAAINEAAIPAIQSGLGNLGEVVGDVLKSVEGLTKGVTEGGGEGLEKSTETLQKSAEEGLNQIKGLFRGR